MPLYKVFMRPQRPNPDSDREVPKQNASAVLVFQCGNLAFSTPYRNVPKIEKRMTTRIGTYPAPIKVNIGPGQAPANAQPKPKMMLP